MKGRGMLAAAAVLGAAAAQGVVEVTAWRGETVNVLEEEFAGEAFEQSSIRAIEHPSNRAIEHPSNRAIEHPSNRAIEHPSRKDDSNAQALKCSNASLSNAQTLKCSSASLQTTPFLRLGARMDVRYEAVPKDRTTYTNAADRVVWLTDRTRADGLSAFTDAPKVLQVQVPPDTPPGVYDFGAVRVKVLSRTLAPAKERPYYLDLWQHPWAVARWHGLKPFSAEHYAAMGPLWRTLAALGQKTITVTLLDLPWNHQCYDGYGTMVRHIRRADGSWAFDYAVFDEYVAFAQGCGLGPDIACYTLCPWGYRVTWEDETGATHRAEAKPGSDLFADYWGAFLADFAAHLKAKGWFERTLIAMDERGPDDVRLIADFVQAKAPGLRVAMAGNRNPGDFKGIRLDVYSQCMEHVTPEYVAEAAARRAQGLVTTYYVCCSPRSPNTFMFSTPAEAFWLGLFPAAAGLDGLLRWAYNSWPLDPFGDASYGNWQSGDTFLVYPDGAPSVRLLMLQNGLEAAEKMRQLKNTGRADVDALAAKFVAADALQADAAAFRALMNEANDVLNREED